MQHNKTIYLHALLILFCTNSHSMETEYHTNEKPVSEHHFATGATDWSSGAESGTIRTGGIYLSHEELEKRRPQRMRFGLDLDDDSRVTHIIPDNDPLHDDDSLLVKLNTFVAIADRNKKAEKMLCELASQGAPLSSCYSTTKMGFGARPKYLLIQKKQSIEGTFSSSFTTKAHKADGVKNVICAVAQDRNARNSALNIALTGADFPEVLIDLTKSFDENSPAELKKVQQSSKEIHQKRRKLDLVMKRAWLNAFANKN